MKLNYLIPNSYRRIAWFVLIPSTIIGLLAIIYQWSPTNLDIMVPVIYDDGFIGDDTFMGWIENNVFNEILGILMIISGVIVAFSREKHEDEHISQIRLKSLVWATYVNYGLLLIALLLFFDLTFLWVMIFNMFTILFFFIARYQWQIYKLNKATGDEE